MATTAPREFVVFFEYNSKEEETFIYYLQWTGNEDALTLLEKATEKANSTQDSYKIIYSLDTSVKLPEHVVDIHCRVINPNNSYHKMFTKCTGSFEPSVTQKVLDELHEHQLGEYLDEFYCGCRIEKQFSDYRNYYQELLEGKITREEYDKIRKNQ